MGAEQDDETVFGCLNLRSLVKTAREMVVVVYSTLTCFLIS
jgi:hypothetical protein